MQLVKLVFAFVSTLIRLKFHFFLNLPSLAQSKATSPINRKCTKITSQLWLRCGIWLPNLLPKISYLRHFRFIHIYLCAPIVGALHRHCENVTGKRFVSRNALPLFFPLITVVKCHPQLIFFGYRKFDTMRFFSLVFLHFLIERGCSGRKFKCCSFTIRNRW